MNGSRVQTFAGLVYLVQILTIGLHQVDPCPEIMLHVQLVWGYTGSSVFRGAIGEQVRGDAEQLGKYITFYLCVPTKYGLPMKMSKSCDQHTPGVVLESKKRRNWSTCARL